MRTVIAVLSVLCVFGSIQGSPEEQKLLRDLLSTYDVASRPVLNETHNISVTVGFQILQIKQLDMESNHLSLDIWLNLKWDDQYLTWDDAAYGGIKKVNVPTKKIWYPDLKIYNGIGDEREETLAIIFNSGVVMHVPPVHTITYCSTSGRWFPFDTQTCNITFGSWTYDALRVTVEAGAINEHDKEYYIENEEWLITDKSISSRLKYYECCVEPYASVTMTLTLKRKSMYYITSQFIPILSLVTLGFFSFAIPIQKSAMRLTLTTLLHLATMVLVATCGKSIPHRSSISVLDVFTGQCMLILSAMVTINIMHMAWINPGKMGAYKKLVNIMNSEKLAKFLHILDKSPPDAKGEDQKETSKMTSELINMSDEQRSEGEVPKARLVFDKVSVIVLFIYAVIVTLSCFIIPAIK